MVPSDAAIDHRDRLARARESVIVASTGQACAVVRAGKRLLQIAHEHIDVALGPRIDPEIGVGRSVMHQRRCRVQSVLLDRAAQHAANRIG